MTLYSTYNNKHKSFARRLRKDQTDAEKFLWSKLKSRQLNGYKFRRQQPIDNYIVDFYCHEKKLVIELDGSQHIKPNNQKYDLMRTAKLNDLGITVLRFNDNDIFENLNGVLEEITKYL